MPVAAELYYHFYQGSNEGQRPPVVLIHGAGGNHLYWPSEVRRLPGYRMYGLDLPGHGKSGGRGQQTVSAYAQVVLDWLEAVGIHSAVFVGHSMGGAIALTLALDHPEHVLGLGLVGTGARLRVAPVLLESSANQATFITAIGVVVRWSFSQSASERVIKLATERMAEVRPSVLHGDLLACNAFDEMERISQISQPALVVCGAEDRMTPARYSQYLADTLQTAVLKTIPDAGHMVMLEKPQPVAMALSDFLNSLSY